MLGEGGGEGLEGKIKWIKIYAFQVIIDSDIAGRGLASSSSVSSTFSCYTWVAHPEVATRPGPQRRRPCCSISASQDLFSCHSQNDNSVYLHIFTVHSQNWVAQTEQTQLEFLIGLWRSCAALCFARNKKQTMMMMRRKQYSCSLWPTKSLLIWFPCQLNKQVNTRGFTWIFSVHIAR